MNGSKSECVAIKPAPVASVFMCGADSGSCCYFYPGSETENEKEMQSCGGKLHWLASELQCGNTIWCRALCGKVAYVSLISLSDLISLVSDSFLQFLHSQMQISSRAVR